MFSRYQLFLVNYFLTTRCSKLFSCYKRVDRFYIYNNLEVTNSIPTNSFLHTPTFDDVLSFVTYRLLMIFPG